MASAQELSQKAADLRAVIDRYLPPPDTRIPIAGLYPDADRIATELMWVFLGFVHICGRSRRGRFLLTRRTDPKRMRATLKAISMALKRRRHDPVPEQGKWLGSVVRGYLSYFAVPTNSQVIARFRSEVIRYWRRHLCQRSQRHRLNWKRMKRLANRWIPPASSSIPTPKRAFASNTRGKSRVR